SQSRLLIARSGERETEGLVAVEHLSGWRVDHSRGARGRALHVLRHRADPAARRARAGHVVVRRAAAECEQGVGCLGARGCDRSLEPLIGEEAAAEQSARDLARHLRDPEPELAVVLLALELEVATREVV